MYLVHGPTKSLRYKVKGLQREKYFPHHCLKRIFDISLRLINFLLIVHRCAVKEVIIFIFENKSQLTDLGIKH